MFAPRPAFVVRVPVVLALAALVACKPADAPRPLPAAVPGGDACRVARVIDGDTVDLRCGAGAAFRARLTGYDTPESFEPGCRAEAEAARAATARLRALVAGAATVEARLGGTDRYGRRLVGLGLDGRDVGAVLIGEGLAVPYAGGPRIDWCARLARGTG